MLARGRAGGRPAGRSVPARPIRVMHLITGLDVGGAESMLSRLVRAMDPASSRHVVVSLTDVGVIGAELSDAGIEVRALGLRRGQVAVHPIPTARRWIQEWQPDLVETWMYHADLLGALVTLGRSSPPLIWNLRASNLDMRRYGRMSGIVRSLCARLSRRPALVIANSEAGLREHRAIGYRPRAWAVVPNGIDADVFTPRPGRRAAVRAALGIPDEAWVVGTVARYDPMKGHDVLVKALAEWLPTRPAAHVLVAGTDVGWEAADYAWLANALGADAGRVHLLGMRRDVADLWAACDVACSPSRSEGFPNAIAEAMACGVPVVATDVGDSARIVDDPTAIVPPGDPSALARALALHSGLAPDARIAAARRARTRIVEAFSLASAAERYLGVYRSVLSM